jgi:hypothetical protein
MFVVRLGIGFSGELHSQRSFLILRSVRSFVGPKERLNSRLSMGRTLDRVKPSAIDIRLEWLLLAQDDRLVELPVPTVEAFFELILPVKLSPKICSVLSYVPRD